MGARILVLGGGAAGIVAAISAAETAPKGTCVTLLERNRRIGKKLLATGNGRCNLDNVNVRSSCYTSHDKGVLNTVLKTVNCNDPLSWFREHGLLTRADSEGRIYPYSNQAADVLNLLLYWLERTGVEVRTGCMVKSVVHKDDKITVYTDANERLTGNAVICGFGGKAGPKFGSDGFGTELAHKLGLKVYPEYPCLVPLMCNKSCISGLAGIRVKASVALTDMNKLLAQDEGEVQFTEQGLSGIVIMQMSNIFKCKDGPKAPILHLDLFPQWNEEKMLEVLRCRMRLLKNSDGNALMTGFVNHRIGAAVWKAAGLGSLNRQISAIQGHELQALARTFHDWRFDSLIPLGWQQAQTTGGGISLREIDPESFALHRYPNICFVGENLDCVGFCGGYNLHWAFGSGITAGRYAAKYVNKKR